MNQHCKIGQVTMKGNLALVPKSEAAINTLAVFRRHAETIASYYPDNLAGFAIVAFDMQGRFARGVEVRKDCFIGQTLLSEFVAAILRRDTAADVTKEILRGEL